MRMTPLEARFRALCLLLSSMLHGSYNANGRNGWGTLWFAKSLEMAAQTGYDRELWGAKIEPYNSMMEELEQMTHSTYQERAELAVNLKQCINALNADYDIPTLTYEELTLSQKASLLLRLRTNQQYRKLAPWEQAFYERLQEDEALKNI